MDTFYSVCRQWFQDPSRITQSEDADIPYTNGSVFAYNLRHLPIYFKSPLDPLYTQSNVNAVLCCLGNNDKKSIHVQSVQSGIIFSLDVADSQLVDSEDVEPTDKESWLYLNTYAHTYDRHTHQTLTVLHSRTEYFYACTNFPCFSLQSMFPPTPINFRKSPI
jgi:hypothetical protein